MKKCGRGVCPGCSRRCPLDAPRCKYGRTCCAKLQAECREKCGRKWKKRLDRDGLLLRLLNTARELKKRLKSGTLSEEQFLNKLDEADWTTLACILDKLESMR